MARPRTTAGAAAAWTAIATIVAASLVPEIRFVVLAGLIAALLLATRQRELLAPIAAVVPTAVYLAWQTLPNPAPDGLAWCGELLAAPVIRTVGGALAVVASFVVLKRMLRTPDADVGLVPPSSRLLAVSLVTGAAVAVGSAALGPIAAGPFFGNVQLKFDDPAALAPALVFALASGSMQELAYRGGMLGWLTPVLGPRVALVAQAVAFGAAHGGSDFVASPLPVMLGVAAGGAIAGLIVQRYRSLTFPIIVHAAFDVPLYYVAACQLI